MQVEPGTIAQTIQNMLRIMMAIVTMLMAIAVALVLIVLGSGGNPAAWPRAQTGNPCSSCAVHILKADCLNPQINLP